MRGRPLGARPVVRGASAGGAELILAVFCLQVMAAVSGAAIPDYYPQHPGLLDAARARFAAQEAGPAAAAARLRTDADAALRVTPRSVVDKKLRAASGDPHDYFSFGPYWWPDPDRTGGLPYIRRDGQTNPEAREGTDRNPAQAMGEAFETLALAYHFTGHEPYAQHATRLLRTWFLDPATRMTPHMRYAQAVPGVSDGRGIGIIEGRYLLYFCESQPLIFASGAWTKEDEKAYREWVEAFRHWLLTSENGRDEADEENNHGTWYDVQVVQTALFLGHREEAREYVARALAHRLATQVEPDGRQPHELARTRSFNYCALNLTGLVRLAVLAEHVGVDAWAIRTEDGRSLERAVAFMAPYVDPAKEWLTRDIDAHDRTRLLPLLAETLRHVNAPELRRLLETHEGTAPADARFRLFR